MENSHLITLEATLSHQAHLDRLCEDRSLETPERFTPNDFYGMASILKQYVGLPNDYALNVVIPHGLSLSLDFSWEAELTASVPAIFYHSKHVKNAYSKNLQRLNIKKFIFPAASTFLYVSKLLAEHPEPERTGTIFFPSHSTHHITAHMDYECLAERLDNLDDKYQPVTVCLYWKDYILGRSLPFAKRGLKVVSAGHMYDPNFLFRLYHLCSIHQYASGNELGSHIFYSIVAGCSYFIFDTVSTSYTVENDVPMPTAEGGFTTYDQMKGAFKELTPTVRQDQSDIVRYHLGYKFLKSSDDLREQLLKFDTIAELLYTPTQFSEINASSVSGQLDRIPSETAEIERQFLYSYFSQIWDGNGDVCEVGPFLGGTTQAIALGLLHNPARQEDTKLYTYDRFKDYYDSDRLISYLQPTIDSGLITEELLLNLKESTSFFDVFQAFHQNQSYSPLVIPIDRSLPDDREDLDRFTNLFGLPPGKTFGAVFVDGCKSWYGTKYFMQQVCPHTLEGAVFIFQDYCWYTCFWLPVFLQRFENYFNPIAYVGGNTFIFQLVESLDAETIDHLFPDRPEDLDEAVFHQIFSHLLLKSYTLDQPTQLLSYTLQYGAALAYIGCRDQSKSIFLNLVTQPWAKPYRTLLESAMCYPTYRPNDRVSLFSKQEVDELLAQAKIFDRPDDELANAQTEIENLQQTKQHQAEQLESLIKNLQQTKQHQAEQLESSHQQLDALQLENNKLIRELEEVQASLVIVQGDIVKKSLKMKDLKEHHKQVRANLRRKLHQRQEELQHVNMQISEFKKSKFYKFREIWILLKAIFGR